MASYSKRHFIRSIVLLQEGIFSLLMLNREALLLLRPFLGLQILIEIQEVVPVQLLQEHLLSLLGLLLGLLLMHPLVEFLLANALDTGNFVAQRFHFYLLFQLNASGLGVPGLLPLRL